MAIPIIHDWEKYFSNPHEGMGSSYERIILNNILREAVRKYSVHKILESPSFGFTGTSGINLLSLVDNGVEVTLEDNDQKRLDLIKDLWEKIDKPLQAVYNPDFTILDYPDASFDMSFSFSALWFVPDLRGFLKELARVTDKVILLSVPNRNGLGYKMQIKDYTPEKYPDLSIGNIDPPSIIAILQGFGWRLETSGYFDCPPWPDIGMTKEDLLYKLFPSCPVRKRLMRPRRQEKPPITILDCYSGKDPDFPKQMMRYNWLEKIAPDAFKKVWAHHYYTKFVRVSG